MYGTTIAAIEDGGYNLPYMLGQIDQLWLERRIDATERDQLKDLARARAQPEDSYAPVPQRVLGLETAMRSLEARVAALENSAATNQIGAGEVGGTVPEWRQPLGAHDAYATGDIVAYGGFVYESLADGNVWSPSDYPQEWREVERSQDDGDGGDQ